MLIDKVPETVDAIFAFGVAALLALLLVPAAEWIARRIGAIDGPNLRSQPTSASQSSAASSTVDSDTLKVIAERPQVEHEARQT